MLQRQLILRFLGVGLVNTGFSFGLYSLLVFLGLPYAIANLIALVAGVIFSFRTQGRWVFGQTQWSRLWRFVPVWAFIYVVNIALITAFMAQGLNAYTGGLAALPVVVGFSFWLQRRWVFAATGTAATAQRPEATHSNQTAP